MDLFLFFFLKHARSSPRLALWPESQNPSTEKNGVAGDRHGKAFARRTGLRSECISDRVWVTRRAERLRSLAAPRDKGRRQAAAESPGSRRGAAGEPPERRGRPARAAVCVLCNINTSLEQRPFLAHVNLADTKRFSLLETKCIYASKTLFPKWNMGKNAGLCLALDMWGTQSRCSVRGKKRECVYWPDCPF